MILFGVNFNIYYLFLCKKWKQAFRSEELRMYFGIILVSILAITINITFNTEKFFPNILESFQHAAFQVGSVITTIRSSILIFILALGCTIVCSSRLTLFIIIRILDTLIPPPVLPAQAPTNISSSKIVWENIGHLPGILTVFLGFPNM